MKQVCQQHGKPDDIVFCPRNNCQCGRIPMWTGYGTPAGVETCTVCKGKGTMTRKEADEVRNNLPLSSTFRPHCICHALK